MALIIGTAGNDVLTGTAAADTIRGLGGDDRIIGSAGSDTIDGGPGFNTVEYGAEAASITANLYTGVVTKPDGVDIIANIVGIVGTRFDDTFVATGAAHAFDGGLGSDTVRYDDAAGAIVGDLAAGTVSHDGVTDTLAAIENLGGGHGGSTLYGTTGDNVLTGGDGLSRLIGRGGNDTLIGVAGVNIGVLDPGLRQTARTTDADGTEHITTATGTTTLHVIQEADFLDGRLVFTAADPVAEVSRLYTVALGRDPDQGGLHVTTLRVEGGTAFALVANDFATSPEFTARFGTLNNGDFVDQLYRNAFGRPADAAGRATWLDQLAHGASRGDVVAGMVNSPETVAASGGKLVAGIWDLSETAAELARLYETALGRLPDAGGLATSKAAIDTGTTTLTAVAAAAVSSDEFTAHYGAESNRAFVTTLFNNALHRAPADADLNAYAGMLDAGTPRAALTVAVSESGEHMALSAPHVLNGDPTQFGILFA